MIQSRGAIVVLLVAGLSVFPAVAESGYKVPVKGLADLVDAPRSPDVDVSPDDQWLLLLEPEGYQPIAELAREELRLAGVRIDPRTNSRSRRRLVKSLHLLPVTGGGERAVSGLPDGARLGNVEWSPDSRRIAFTVTGSSSVELWLADVASARARRLMETPLNGILGEPCAWLPDSSGLVCKTVPAGRGPAPRAPEVPTSPVIAETTGEAAPARTYQDLLASSHDADLFEFLVTVQVVQVGPDGRVTPVGKPAMVSSVSPSPSGQYLLRETAHRPFSYLVPVWRFPTRIEVQDLRGKVIHTIADLPLAETVPVDRDAARIGPRAAHWRQDVPATVAWVEAQDGGDPKTSVEVRDRLFTLAAPFTGKPVVLASLGLRFSGIDWGSDSLALVRDRWWKNRRTRTFIITPDKPAAAPRLLFDLSSEDRYADPGQPQRRHTSAGGQVLLITEDGKGLFLVGRGASPEGDRPFVDALDIASRETHRLWRSEGPVFETPLALLDDSGKRLLTSRESPEEPPNVFLRDLAKGTMKQLTDHPHPTPALLGVSKQLIHYRRADGVPLTATLYLPRGYTVDQGPLPTLVWAYPREYKSAAAAGQVRTSPHRFVQVSPTSPLAFLAVGYAVLAGAAMPIIGEGESEPNDSYVSQLVASGQAAVDELVRRGVSARGAIAIGGHSYGAFMAANLLAHSDLFAAGIARSGAYNRTLTPFSFQAEERTLWEARDTYIAISPFMHAHKVNEPILLIHGQLDNNSGTFPMQSERFFNAIKGLGGTARLVFLPKESHGYRARESLLHMLWEQHTWLDKHLAVEK